MASAHRYLFAFVGATLIAATGCRTASPGSELREGGELGATSDVTPFHIADCDDAPICDGDRDHAGTGFTCSATDEDGNPIADGGGGDACRASRSLQDALCDKDLRPSDFVVTCVSDQGDANTAGGAGCSATKELTCTTTKVKTTAGCPTGKSRCATALAAAPDDKRLKKPPPLYPDKTLTPGKVDPKATKEKVCTPLYTKSIRNVSDADKKAVFARYKIPFVANVYEIDHLISLELGGSNDIDNLWPQPYDPDPSAREKDLVETDLHRRICKGIITLKEAQKIITTDWHAEYKKIQASSN